MHIVRIAAVAALLAAAAGCAGNPFPAGAMTASQLADPARGVVLLSTGAVQRCTMTAMWGPVYQVDTRSTAPGSPIVAIDAPSESDFPDHFGTLSTLSLPPGRYAVSVQYANPELESTGKPPAVAFDVVAGQVTYIGELWRETPCQIKASVLVRDRYDRDVELATRLNPAFAAHPPVKSLGQWMPWSTAH